MATMIVGGIIGAVLAVALVGVLLLTGLWPFPPASAPSVLTSFTLGVVGVLLGEYIAVKRWG